MHVNPHPSSTPIKGSALEQLGPYRAYAAFRPNPPAHHRVGAMSAAKPHDINSHLAALLHFSRELRRQAATQNSADILPVLFPLMTLLEECDMCIKTLYQAGQHQEAVSAMAANNLHLSLPAVWGWLEAQAAMPEPSSTDMLRLDGHLMQANTSRRYLLVRSLIASFVIFEGLWKAAVACREGQEDAIEDPGHDQATKLMDGILSLKAPIKLFVATCRLKSRMARDPAGTPELAAVPEADPISISDDWFYQVRARGGMNDPCMRMQLTLLGPRFTRENMPCNTPRSDGTI